MTATKNNFAQKAAAAARKGDHENAYILYARAAHEAETKGKWAAAKRHRRNESHHQNVFEAQSGRA